MYLLVKLWALCCTRCIIKVGLSVGSLCQVITMSPSAVKLTVCTSLADEPPIVSGGSSGDPADTHLEMKGIQLRGAPMYLDMQATTPLDPRVLDKMLPYLTEQYGNPHSRTHMYGWESEDAVEVARKQVSSLLTTPLLNDQTLGPVRDVQY